MRAPLAISGLGREHIIQVNGIRGDGAQGTERATLTATSSA